MKDMIMIVTSKKSYAENGVVGGELRVGWASWDDGTYQDRSIKFAYLDRSGKVSRGAPELSFDTLINMWAYANETGDLAAHLAALPPKAAQPLETMETPALREVKKTLQTALASLQWMALQLPEIDWAPVYNDVGARDERVKAELLRRR